MVIKVRIKKIINPFDYSSGGKLNSIISLLFTSILLISIIVIFVKISMKIRCGGGSIPYFLSSGAMDATLDMEKKAATKVIVECNAHKKMEEQSSFDPPAND